MKQGAHLRLIVAAVLFIGWLGWLTYLAATATRPVVLSRPQVLMADAHVTAKVEEGEEGRPSSTVTIVNVISAPGQKAKLAAGATLEVAYLDLCGEEQGWTGAGEYLLPLKKLGTDAYGLTEIPPSPGYLPQQRETRIYRASAEALRQLNQLLTGRE